MILALASGGQGSALVQYEHYVISVQGSRRPGLKMRRQAENERRVPEDEQMARPAEKGPESEGEAEHRLIARGVNKTGARMRTKGANSSTTVGGSTLHLAACAGAADCECSTHTGTGIIACFCPAGPQARSRRNRVIGQLSRAWVRAVR